MWLGAAASAALVAALLCIRPAHAAIHHAALVIQHASGSVITRCVAFAEDQISGLQLIQRSGVQYEAQSFGSIGTAMCQLDREPSTVPPGCFGSGPYWQYFHRQGGGWQTSTFGASSSVLHDEDMDGWHYAAGAQQAPGNVAFASVCGVPAPAPAVIATAGAKPPYHATPMPTVTPAATTSIEALAPTVSPKAAAVLTSTGAPTQPPQARAMGPWLAFGSMAILLLTLGAFNLRRRGP
ncbi:MAG: hypothetical protein M3Z28_11770 [Candidatus Dormibacteraeota bacterium]|nr:hypothetical protein [Candidatus Dormibacteraeota bacterium]